MGNGCRKESTQSFEITHGLILLDFPPPRAYPLGDGIGINKLSRIFLAGFREHKAKLHPWLGPDVAPHLAIEVSTMTTIYHHRRRRLEILRSVGFLGVLILALGTAFGTPNDVPSQESVDNGNSRRSDMRVSRTNNTSSRQRVAQSPQVVRSSDNNRGNSRRPQLNYYIDGGTVRHHFVPATTTNGVRSGGHFVTEQVTPTRDSRYNGTYRGTSSGWYSSRRYRYDDDYWDRRRSGYNSRYRGDSSRYRSYGYAGSFTPYAGSYYVGTPVSMYPYTGTTTMQNFQVVPGTSTPLLPSDRDIDPVAQFQQNLGTSAAASTQSPPVVIPKTITYQDVIGTAPPTPYLGNPAYRSVWDVAVDDVVLLTRDMSWAHMAVSPIDPPASAHLVQTLPAGSWLKIHLIKSQGKGPDEIKWVLFEARQTGGAYVDSINPFGWARVSDLSRAEGVVQAP